MREEIDKRIVDILVSKENGERQTKTSGLMQCKMDWSRRVFPSEDNSPINQHLWCSSLHSLQRTSVRPARPRRSRLAEVHEQKRYEWLTTNTTIASLWKSSGSHIETLSKRVPHVRQDILPPHVKPWRKALFQYAPAKKRRDENKVFL